MKGAFSEPEGYFSSASRERPSRSPEKRNFYTSPPRKGGSGFPNIGIGRDFEYKGESFDAAAARAIAERKKGREKWVAGAFTVKTATDPVFDKKVYSADDKGGCFVVVGVANKVCAAR